MIPLDAIDAVPFTRFDRRPWLSLDRFLTMLGARGSRG